MSFTRRPVRVVALIKPAFWLSILTLLTLFIAACGPSAHAAAPQVGTAASLPPPVNCPGCWHPELKTSWQWQLTGNLDQSINVAMYDIDGFTNSADLVKALHAAGRKVICYISVGTWEKFRPDASKFPSKVRGNVLDGFPDERWLDIRDMADLEPIMAARLDMCKAKGFDGVEPDNVDGYANTSGFPLTGRDQLKYNTWIANQAHQRGLSVALKNDTEQIKDLLPYFDWELDEQCFGQAKSDGDNSLEVCHSLQNFTRAGKAVMEVEYSDDGNHETPSLFCPQANKMNFNSLYKHMVLDAYRVACR
ncbi:endo alpha-1,4 polygalactosaminidase [Ktedonosporobacter rubrisoli]|uniref:Endo alpha-1,4 polygalactosaminidase n=1 Tax=Ktedonosporobacter rubrisoli TaxID=2509675 RepID=A0A4P6JHY0_KTERU|nr:endo alpha-1,4 polygalactosaminidase [Ktedonosporobacter rubrisoli]QBD74654.1 endo alpha-1,4 polygalactosaminidase [Ktedonosporobacter rubrisoli]